MAEEGNVDRSCNNKQYSDSKDVANTLYILGNIFKPAEVEEKIAQGRRRKTWSLS